MFGTIGAIAAGGAIGAVARHLTSTGVMALFKAPFPWGILTVNVIGSFLMGMLMVALVQVWDPPEHTRHFLTTGFLGGFTTFSAFSADTMALWMRGDVYGAATYVMGSVVLSIAAVFLGSWLIWKFVA